MKKEILKRVYNTWKTYGKCLDSFQLIAPRAYKCEVCREIEAELARPDVDDLTVPTPEQINAYIKSLNHDEVPVPLPWIKDNDPNSSPDFPWKAAGQEDQPPGIVEGEPYEKILPIVEENAINETQDAECPTPVEEVKTGGDQ